MGKAFARETNDLKNLAQPLMRMKKMEIRYKLLIFLPLLVLFMNSCKGDDNSNSVPQDNTRVEIPQEPATPLDFSGQVNGLNGGRVKLIGQVGATTFLMDSAEVAADGSFSFAQDTAIVAGLYFVLMPDQKNYFQVMIDRDQQFSMTTDLSNLAGAMQVEGSLDNELLYKNLKFESDFQNRFNTVDAQLKAAQEGTPQHTTLTQQRDALIQERKDHLQWFKDNHPNSFFTIYKVAGQNPELREPKLANGTLDTVKQVYFYRNEYWDNVDFNDERLLHTPVIANKLENYISKFTPQTIDSVIKYSDLVIQKSMVNKEMFKFFANQLAIKYQKNSIMGGEAIFLHLVDNYFTDSLAFWSTPQDLADIRKQANEFRPSLIGNSAQDIKCKNPNGEYESLLDLKSEVIILYMYSYDCDHCRERTPVMLEVYEKWKSKGLDVYALCVDPEKDKWTNFINAYHIQDWHNVHDPSYESRYYAKYHVDITPEVYVIDQERKIVAKDLHPNQLEPFLKDLLD